MAISTLTVSSFNPLHHIFRTGTHHSPATTVKASTLPPPSACSSSSADGSKRGSNSLCAASTTQKKPNRRIVDLGLVGLLAASVVGFGAPLDADATRIEYYATVSEPSCELNFVRSGLGYCDVVQGSGPEAPYNELINIHYTARFGDEIVFDSSYKRGRPLTMRIGVGKVIKGLDQGIFGGDGVPRMHVGGKRKLRVPPELAYGPEPAGCFFGDCNVPANATLLYDIHFVGVYSGNRK